MWQHKFPACANSTWEVLRTLENNYNSLCSQNFLRASIIQYIHARSMNQLLNIGEVGDVWGENLATPNTTQEYPKLIIWVKTKIL